MLLRCAARLCVRRSLSGFPGLARCRAYLRRPRLRRGGSQGCSQCPLSLLWTSEGPGGFMKAPTAARGLWMLMTMLICRWLNEFLFRRHLPFLRVPRQLHSSLESNVTDWCGSQGRPQGALAGGPWLRTRVLLDGSHGWTMKVQQPRI